MEKSIEAQVNLTRFKDHSEVKMSGPVSHLLALCAVFIDKLAKEIDESPHGVLMKIDRRIVRARILKCWRGDRS